MKNACSASEEHMEEDRDKEKEYIYMNVCKPITNGVKEK